MGKTKNGKSKFLNRPPGQKSSLRAAVIKNMFNDNWQFFNFFKQKKEQKSIEKKVKPLLVIKGMKSEFPPLQIY